MFCINFVCIIDCDSTLYVGMTRKQNGRLRPRIHYSFVRYHLWTGIKPKPAFRNRSLPIIEVVKLLISRKNMYEVVNR